TAESARTRGQNSRLRLSTRRRSDMRGCSWDSESDAEPVTDDERLRREARHRAHQQMGFLQHLAIFIPVMLLILAIDVLTPDGWFINCRSEEHTFELQSHD